MPPGRRLRLCARDKGISGLTIAGGQCYLSPIVVEVLIKTMTSRHLCGLMIAVVLLAVSFVDTHAQPQWQKVAPPDGSFTDEMPALPEYFTVKNKTAAGADYALHQYVANYGGGFYLMQTLLAPYGLLRRSAGYICDIGGQDCPLMRLTAEQHCRIAAVYENAAADMRVPPPHRTAFMRKANSFRVRARIRSIEEDKDQPEETRLEVTEKQLPGVDGSKFRPLTLAERLERACRKKPPAASWGRSLFRVRELERTFAALPPLSSCGHRTYARDWRR